MKYVFLLLLIAHAVLAQTKPAEKAGIRGTVVDAKTQDPIPGAVVTASRTGVPPFMKSTKTGGDGAFEIQGLTTGDYLVCVLTAGEQYLNPCEWDGVAYGITLSSTQVSAGIKIELTPASVLSVQVKDATKALAQLTKEGRRADLTIGVWGPKGLYRPARAVNATADAPGPQGSSPIVAYWLAVPRDTALSLYIASRDFKLGDANGVALPDNASQQAFRHASGDAKPRSFTFTVIGKLP
jgi:hypothetical protein